MLSQGGFHMWNVSMVISTSIAVSPVLSMQRMFWRMSKKQGAIVEEWNIDGLYILAGPGWQTQPPLLRDGHAMKGQRGTCCCGLGTLGTSSGWGVLPAGMVWGGGMADCVLVLTLGIASYRGCLTDIEHHGHCLHTQLVWEAGHLPDPPLQSNVL